MRRWLRLLVGLGCCWVTLAHAGNPYEDDDYYYYREDEPRQHGEPNYVAPPARQFRFPPLNNVSSYQASCVVKDGVLDAVWRVQGTFYPEKGIVARVGWSGRHGRKWGRLQAPECLVETTEAVFRLRQWVPTDLDHLTLHLVPCSKCKPMWCQPRYHIRYFSYGNSVDNLRRLHYEYRHLELGVVIAIQIAMVLLLGYVLARTVYRVSSAYYLRWHACVPQKCEKSLC